MASLILGQLKMGEHQGIDRALHESIFSHEKNTFYLLRAYCNILSDILPWRVVNVIPLWGAVIAIRLRESFLTKAQRNLRTVRFLLTLAGKFI